ncbi:sugar phosphate permease [Thraustotheca clavata]|uniref:Sugar phosphate permease n=1 Tax=Thraustotheca clavata TaxID=74557 RepID=A0A1V9ZXW3_9STRA|nr:sugar phosphate permease [Thraustotheca clavata]
MNNVVQISKRLDNLPIRGLLGVSGYYWGLLLKAGVGWGMDSLDTFLFTYLGSHGWQKSIVNYDVETKTATVLNGRQLGLLGSASFAGSLFGAILFGQLADTFGRKPMFMLTLLVFMLATLVCGAADSYGMLLSFRFIAGFGLGGELPVASALVQELTPAPVRGRIIVLLESFWSIGCMVSVLLAFELTKSVSWRTVFYISAIPALYAVAIRFLIPESPKWLANVGRMDEAEAIVEKIEKAHGVVHDKANDKVEVDHADDEACFDVSGLTPLERIGLMFRGEFLSRTIVLWIVWICLAFSYYAIYIWLPSLRSKEKNGFNLNGSTWTMLFIIFWQFPGYFSAAYLVEIIGRKITLSIYLVGSFVSAMAFGYVENTQTNLMITGAFMSWFMLGSWGSLYAYTPENYPTPIRAMGASYPIAVCRIGSIAGPYIVPIMIENGCSSKTIMWVCSSCLLLAAIVLLIFGFESRGKNVESAPQVEAYLKQKGGYSAVIMTPQFDEA